MDAHLMTVAVSTAAQNSRLLIIIRRYYELVTIIINYKMSCFVGICVFLSL